VRRPLLLALSLVTLLSLPAVAGAAGQPGRALGTATTDASGDGAADLLSARLEQVDHTLTVWLGFTAPPDPAQFSAAGGGRVCVWLTGAGTSRPLCASTVDGVWQFNQTGEVLVIGERRLGLRFPDDVLKLRPGTLHWHVSTTAAGCVPAPDTPACIDRLPEARKDIRGRVFRPQLTGCVATGDDQLSNGPRDRPRIALTFDDGPWSYTSTVLDILKQNRARATFFEIGRQVNGRGAALARRVLAEGHEIGNHSWNHSDLHAAGDGATKQLKDTNAAIRDATGFTPCLFRPPYGVTSRDLADRVRALGMTSVLWDADTNDYQRLGVDAISAHLLNDPQNGSIMLMHDGGGNRAQTVAALRASLPALRARYELVTVSELLGYASTYTLVR